MDELPEECVEKVMSFAGPLQTSQMAVLSRTLRSASQSEQLWEGFLPVGYESVIAQSSSHNLLWISDARQLMRRLCHRPLLIDRGKKSWMLDKRTGKIKMMMSANADLEMPSKYANSWKVKKDPDCWFNQRVKTMSVSRPDSLEIRGRIHTRRLSPSTMYAAYLVFKLENVHFGFDSDRSIKATIRFMGRGRGGGGGDGDCERELSLGLEPNMARWEHTGVGLALSMGLYRSPTRQMEMEWNKAMISGDSGWLEAKLGEFWNDGEEDGDDDDEDEDYEGNEVEIFLKSVLPCLYKHGLTVYGIELRPCV